MSDNTPTREQVARFDGGPLDGTTLAVPRFIHWFKVPVTEYRNYWYPPETHSTPEVSVRTDVYERISETRFVWRYRR